MHYEWNLGYVRKVLAVPVVVMVVVTLEEWSFIYRKDTSPVNSGRGLGRDLSTKAPLITRNGSNLVYWTPHKTGSTSMRWWLKQIAKYQGLQCIGGDFYYPYSNFTDHVNRRQLLQTNKSCAIVMGHIRVLSVANREDELRLGAAITTTRDAFNTLASKYFHRTAEKLTPETFDAFKIFNSYSSRRWFFYWHDSNPCEPLQYYDGLDHCNPNDEEDIELRSRRIADRIDCTVDMDDPSDDVKAICAKLMIPSISCPEFPERNTQKGRSLYDQFSDIPHIREILARNLHVTSILRRHLMTKRCRFLNIRNITPPGYENPKWPSADCV